MGHRYCEVEEINRGCRNVGSKLDTGVKICKQRYKIVKVSERYFSDTNNIVIYLQFCSGGLPVYCSQTRRSR